MNYKSIVLNILLFCCFQLVLQAQSSDTPIEVSAAQPTIAHLFNENESIDPIITKDILSDATYLEINKKQLDELMLKRPQQLILSLPQTNGAKIKLLLEQKQILTDDFKVSAPHTKQAIDYEPGLYYQGEVLGQGKTIAAISIFSNYVMGVFSFGGENYVLGHLNPDTYPAGNDYILYKESNLLITNPFQCESLSIPYDHGDTFQIDPEIGKSAGATNSVKVYFEADYDLYTNKGGSTTNATDYVTGLFNIVSALYNAENIIAEISEIYVWTSTDPYPSNGSSAAMNAFRSRLNGNFNGDVAHLLSIDASNNGGIAYVDVLCQKSYAVAYSDIGSTYNDNPVPTYSWTTEVVTHEMGHNLGSPHTQSCSWPGGAIDNCVSVEGSCSPGPTPSNGGTIMSYCHLTNVGINYANGFGPLPGDLIRSEVNGASCLTASNGGGNSGGGSGGGNNGGGGSTGTPNLTRSTANLTVNGSSVSVDLTVINNGDGNASTSKVTYFLTTDNQITSADPVLGSKSIPAITAGSSTSNINLTVDVNSLNVAPATYYVAYVIDVDGIITESNEGDNAFWWNNIPVNISNESYCPSEGESTYYEYISYVKVGNLINDTGDDDGYTMTTSSETMPVGTSLPIDLRPGYYASAYREYWRIWIDLNQDMDFDDIGELVYDSGSAVRNNVTGNLIIPTSALGGATRMRVSMRGSTDYSAPAECGNFQYGEVEDYEISLQAAQLPLTLIDFNGSAERDYNLLSWTTATEESTAFHYIERSVDGKSDFKIIEQVAAAGNSQIDQFYQVKDHAPLRRAYYRLRTINTDGSEDISGIVFVERTNTKTLEINQIYPNPAKDQVTIEWTTPSTGTTTIRLMDFTGRVMEQRILEGTTVLQQVEFSVASLATGIYFVTIENGGEVISQKIAVQ